MQACAHDQSWLRQGTPGCLPARSEHSWWGLDFRVMTQSNPARLQKQMFTSWRGAEASVSECSHPAIRTSMGRESTFYDFRSRFVGKTVGWKNPEHTLNCFWNSFKSYVFLRPTVVDSSGTRELWTQTCRKSSMSSSLQAETVKAPHSVGPKSSKQEANVCRWMAAALQQCEVTSLYAAVSAMSNDASWKSLFAKSAKPAELKSVTKSEEVHLELSYN